MAGMTSHNINTADTVLAVMSNAGNDKIQFRGAREKEALELLDDLRLGGVNASELARQGITEVMRRTLSTEEKIEIHQRYKAGEIEADVARVLLGDDLTQIEREREAFEEAMERDTDGVFQD